MSTRKGLFILSLLLIASMLLTACGGATETESVETGGEETETGGEEAPPPTEEMGEEGVVTLYAYSTTDIPGLDPQVEEDVVSINNVENLFMNLTNYDLETSEIVPEAATSWDISDDGLLYTFYLRDDIPWVFHNPVTGETTQAERVVDEESGETAPAFLTAGDFVFGIRRACDPNIGSYYSSVIAPQIKGCADVLDYEDPSSIPAELVEAIGVTALDDYTLQIELEFPASYFLSMTPMWTLAATPEWVIAEHGDQWVEAGNIVTNGRFVLHEWVHNVRRQVWRNPLFPADMAGTGNIEQIVTNVVPDTSTGYALWLNGEVDIAAIPDAELQAHLDAYPDETIQVPDLAVFYIAFRTTKAPFDNVHVRRAFSAAFDRETFVAEIRQGQGLPMIHFAPPGIFGAPRIDEVGVGYDPEFAAAEMVEAGYPNCDGFPQVTLLGYSGQATLNWIEFAQNAWSETLGCDPELIQIEQQPFAELLAATAASVPDEDSPHMWTLAWGPDYADENNWVGDVLWCENPGNRTKRACTEIDDLIVQAREESDPAVRLELYRQVEEGFFGPEGEYPFFPIWVRIAFVAEHTWVDRTVALFGGQQWYNWSLDTAERAAY